MVIHSMLLVDIYFPARKKKFGMQQLKHTQKWGMQHKFYELKQLIHGTIQADWSVATYFHKLCGLWQDLDHYQNLQTECAANAIKI